jgi:hypothetical protein
MLVTVNDEERVAMVELAATRAVPNELLMKCIDSGIC